MAQVTVGVPVYNGAEFLSRSLVCLRDQTYRDIEVLIFDNCSEDETGEIARRFCAEDPRFHYFRQSENKGPTPNFLAALEASQSPFFLWRAADDTSDADYIEKLLALLLAHPERDIAVSRIVSLSPEGRPLQVHSVSPMIAKSGALGRLGQLFYSHHGSWIYGVFRRDAMIPVLKDVMATYPYVWGWDNVTMFSFEFDRKVIGTNATSFQQYVRARAAGKSRARRAKRDDDKIAMGRAFMAYARRHVRREIGSPLERAFYQVVLTYFGHRRVASFSKILRRRVFSAFDRAAVAAPEGE